VTLAMLQVVGHNSRVSPGISARASHRTGRAPLSAYGSCSSNHALTPNFQ